jgi:RNA polymerase sigma-70 factor (ECF subfamily)
VNAENDELRGLRHRLFLLAYRMLGRPSDAEDIVQEAFVRWHAQSRGHVVSTLAFMTTIVTRLCLDQIKSARNRLETYPGVWLPEPLSEAEFDDLAGAAHSSPEEHLQRLEAVSLAFIAVLQALSPLERAVYLLSEIFDYRHADVAAIVDRTPQACRQALHRARQSVAAADRGDPPSEHHKVLLASFIRACRQGDLDQLTQLLADDVESRADGGGYVTAATKPVVGVRAVARLFAGFGPLIPNGLSVRILLVGRATALMTDGETLLSVLQVCVRGVQICRIDNVISPEKLDRLAGSLGLKTSLRH